MKNALLAISLFLSFTAFSQSVRTTITSDGTNVTVSTPVNTKVIPVCDFHWVFVDGYLKLWIEGNNEIIPGGRLGSFTVSGATTQQAKLDALGVISDQCSIGGGLDSLYFDGVLLQNGDSISTSGIVDGDKGDVDVTASGATWTVDTSAITTIKIAADAVTSAKIADGTIAAADLATTGVSADTYNNVTVNTKGQVTAGSNVAYLTTEVDGSTTNELTLFTAAGSAPGSPKQGDVWWKNSTDSVFIYQSAAWAFLAIRAGAGGSDLDSLVSASWDGSTLTLTLQSAQTVTATISNVVSGSGAPGGSPGTGQRIYIDYTNNQIYWNDNGTWTILGGVNIPLTDAGGYFTTDNTEAALQQLGATVAAIPTYTASQGIQKNTYDFRLGGSYFLNHPSKMTGVRGLNTGNFKFYIGQDNADSLKTFVFDVPNKRFGIGSQFPNAKLRITGNGNTSSTFSFWAGNSDSTKMMRFQDDGRLLIGDQITNYLDLRTNSITIGGYNSTPGSFGVVIGHQTEGVGSQNVAIGAFSKVTGTQSVVVGAGNIFSGSLNKYFQYGTDLRTNISNSGIIGLGRSGSSPLVQTESGSVGIGNNSGIPVAQYRGFDASLTTTTWTRSNDTITLSSPTTLMTKNMGIGLSDGPGLVYEYATILEVVSSTKLKITTITGTSGSVVVYNASQLCYVSNLGRLADKFWSILPNGQQRNHYYGTGQFSGTIGTMAAYASDGKVIEPTASQIKTYLGIGGGTGRSITADQSYTAADLGQEIEITDSSDNSDFITYTLPASPAGGDIIYIINTSTVNDADDGAQINGNGKNIMGAATYEFTGTGTIVLRFSSNRNQWSIY